MATTPFVPINEFISSDCAGFNRIEYYADGCGGKYTKIIPNSTECGYVPPLPTSKVAAARKDAIDRFNELTTNVNELFGDIHANQGLVNNQIKQDKSKWGWGGQNVELMAKGNKITAMGTNKLVNRVNLSTYRTKSSEDELVIVEQGETITAEFYNAITTLLDGARGKRNHVAPNLTTLSTLGTYDSSDSSTLTPWKNSIESTIELNFGGYDFTRHFFNAGGDIRLTLTIAGGHGAGYNLWRSVVYDMGTLKLNGDSCISLNSRGISQDIGVNELLATEQLLYTSPTSSSGGIYGGYGGNGDGCGGYGGYGSYGGGGGGYGGYAASRLKIYGHFNNGNLILRSYLDHSQIGIVVNGRVTMTVSMSHPTTVTENDVTLTIPIPTFSLNQPWSGT